MRTVRVNGVDIEGNERSYFVIDEDKEEVKIVPKLTEKQKRLLNDKLEFKSHQNKLGGFVNVIFVSNELLFNNLLNPQDTFRFIFMSTFLDYNNNLLVTRGICNTKRPITKHEIMVDMRVNKKPFDLFWSNLIKNELIYEVEDKTYVNPKYFVKGKVPKECGNEYSRIYIDTIKILYYGSVSKQHRSLGYILKLLPKMNYKTNYIVHNPNETNISMLKPYTLEEICEELRLSTDKSNMKKFYKSLNETTIKMDDNKEYKVFTKITVDSKYDYFLINPLVVYKGKYMSDVNEMLEWLLLPMNE